MTNMARMALSLAALGLGATFTGPTQTYHHRPRETRRERIERQHGTMTDEEYEAFERELDAKIEAEREAEAEAKRIKAEEAARRERTEPVRDDFPSRQAFRAAHRKWSSKYGGRDD